MATASYQTSSVRLGSHKWDKDLVCEKISTFQWEKIPRQSLDFSKNCAGISYFITYLKSIFFAYAYSSGARNPSWVLGRWTEWIGLQHIPALQDLYAWQPFAQTFWKQFMAFETTILCSHLDFDLLCEPTTQYNLSFFLFQQKFDLFMWITTERPAMIKR